VKSFFAGSAVLLATWASAETAIHLVSTSFLLSPTRPSPSPADSWSKRSSTTTSNTWPRKPIWEGEKLKNPAGNTLNWPAYNRELINWHLDDKLYRDYVLSPVITAKPGEQLNWRRPLWEEFYPRIRHESSPEAAAAIVTRHLRERVTIAPDYPKQPGVETMWRRQIVNQGISRSFTPPLCVPLACRRD